MPSTDKVLGGVDTIARGDLGYDNVGLSELHENLKKCVSNVFGWFELTKDLVDKVVSHAIVQHVLGTCIELSILSHILALQAY